MVVVSIFSRFGRILAPFPKNSQKCKKQASITTCVVYCLCNENPSNPPTKKKDQRLEPENDVLFLKWISSWGEIFEVPCWISASFPHSPTNTQLPKWIHESDDLLVKEFPTQQCAKIWLGLPGIRDPLWNGFCFELPSHHPKKLTWLAGDPSSPHLHPQVWRWCDLPSQHLSILRPFHGDHLRGVDLSRLGGKRPAGEDRAR